MEAEIMKELAEIKRFALLGAKNVLTMDDASLLTGLSKGTIYKKVCSKEIPYYKSQGGKLTYFEKEDLEKWCLNYRVATTTEIEQVATNYVVTGRMQKGGAL